MQVIIYVMFAIVIIAVLKQTRVFDILMRKIGYIGVKEVHYNINQKIVRQIKTSCHHNKDAELTHILLMKDSIARPKRYYYTGHLIIPDGIFFTWKKRKLLPFGEKISVVLHNMIHETLGVDMPIEANGLFNHDMLWLPIPTKRYLDHYDIQEKQVFDKLFDVFEEMIHKQFRFDLVNIGTENVIRGAQMSRLWQAQVRQQDQLPRDFTSPVNRDVREMENE